MKCCTRLAGAWDSSIFTTILSVFWFPTALKSGKPEPLSNVLALSQHFPILHTVNSKQIRSGTLTYLCVVSSNPALLDALLDWIFGNLVATEIFVKNRFLLSFTSKADQHLNTCKIFLYEIDLVTLQLISHVFMIRKRCILLWAVRDFKERVAKKKDEMGKKLFFSLSHKRDSGKVSLTMQENVPCFLGVDKLSTNTYILL